MIKEQLEVFARVKPCAERQKYKELYAELVIQ